MLFYAGASYGRFRLRLLLFFLLLRIPEVGNLFEVDIEK
jgi:hypothetical protein